MSWTYLPRIGRGVAVGKYDALNPDDVNLNIGDEVYVFEAIDSGDWYRGYVISSPLAHSAFNQPLPRSTKIVNGTLKPLDANVQCGVFPAGLIVVKEFFDLPVALKDGHASDAAIPSLSEFTGASVSGTIINNDDYDQAVNAHMSNGHGKKPKAPSVPTLRIGNEFPTMENEPLVDDIAAVVKEWFYTYVYYHFLYGNYSLVVQIAVAIKDLCDIRRKLLYGLYTRDEKIIARKKAVWLIARVTKILKRGIIVREASTGSIMASSDGPVRLAQEQILLALSPNYPDHATVGDVTKTATLPKHILVDFKSCVGAGYGHGLTVFLLLRTKTRRLTEAFTIKVKPKMSVADLSSVLFKDLPVSMVKDDVFLIAKVYEDVALQQSAQPVNVKKFIGGSLNQQATAGASDAHEEPVKYGRRGVAAGAADISRLFRMEDTSETPFKIKMYASYFDEEGPTDENAGWGELLDRIVRGRPKGVAITSRAEQVVCTVKEFEAPSVANIEHLQNGDTVRAISMAKSLFASSFVERQDDVYIHLGKVALTYSGPVQEFLLVKTSSSSGKANFTKSSNGMLSHEWDSLAAVNREVIGEMVGVSNFDRNESVIFKLYIGGQFLGKAAVPMWHNNRVFSGKKLVEFTRDGNVVATLNTVFEFVGNTYNTDPSIDKIIHWKMYLETGSVNEFIPVLQRFKTVDEQEFLKKFHAVIDALLEMLLHFSTSDRNDLTMAIFTALVYTLEKVTARSSEYTYLGNDYLNARFNFGGLAEVILEHAEYIVREFQLNPDVAINLFKVSSFMTRIITASAEIDFDRGHETQEYVKIAIRKRLGIFMDGVKHILAVQEKAFIELQTVIMSQFFCWCENLKKFVYSDDLVQMLIETLDTIRTDSEKLNTQRLLLIRQFSKCWLYHEAKYRPHITAYTIKWTLPFWLDSRDFTASRRDQLRLLSSIFAGQFSILWPVRHQEPEVCKRYGQLLPVSAKLYTDLLTMFESSKRKPCTVFSPLFPQNYPFETRAVDSVVNDAIFDETLLELGIVFTMLVNLAHFSGEHVIDASLTQIQVSDLAYNIIRACNAMLNCVAFPKMWITLLAVHHETVMGCLEYLSTLMTARFIPSPEAAEDFNSELWYVYLNCILQVAGSEAVAVEHLPEQKRTAVWKICGDIRGRAVKLLQSMWNSIGWRVADDDKVRFGIDIFGGFQVQMFGGETSLVKDVLNLCLVRHPESQRVAVSILQSMIVSEWTLNEDLTGLQREIIASLDDIFQQRAFLPGPYETAGFNSLLRDTMAIDKEDEAFPFVERLMDDVSEFLELLLGLYNVPPGDAYNDDRVFHALNVLNFLKDIDRVEIFSRYVNDIAMWNRSKLNYVQTGLALKLLASAYEWSYDQKLEASEHPNFPAQTGFERKEALYEDIIQSFTRGKAFENAIECTKELISAYESVSLDFRKLANSTRVLAKLYESVDSIERMAPQYFRVSYIGVGFPKSLRDRIFIFEGSPWEKLESIHERLHKTYPGAKIVSKESEAKNDGQYLFVSAVQPESAMKNNIPGLTAGAREFHARANLKSFSYSRPLPGNTSPLDLWVEKTTYETYQTFPTIVKRSEVKNVSVSKVSPLENALSVLETKCADLQDLESVFKSGKADQSHVSRLDLVLSGAVDSPVNGGIQVFRQFFDDESLKKTQPELLSALDLAFLNYAACIQQCLVIHGRVVPPTLKPLHDSLVQLFERNFASELALLGDPVAWEERQGSLLNRSSSVSYGSSIAPSVSTNGSGKGQQSKGFYDTGVSSLDSLLDNAVAASNNILRDSASFSKDNESILSGSSSNSRRTTTNNMSINGLGMR